MDASLRFERSLERIVAEHKFMRCEENLIVKEPVISDRTFGLQRNLLWLSLIPLMGIRIHHFIDDFLNVADEVLFKF